MIPFLISVHTEQLGGFYYGGMLAMGIGFVFIPIAMIEWRHARQLKVNGMSEQAKFHGQSAKHLLIMALCISIFGWLVSFCIPGLLLAFSSEYELNELQVNQPDDDEAVFSDDPDSDYTGFLPYTPGD